MQGVCRDIEGLNTDVGVEVEKALRRTACLTVLTRAALCGFHDPKTIRPPGTVLPFPFSLSVRQAREFAAGVSTPSLVSPSQHPSDRPEADDEEQEGVESGNLSCDSGSDKENIPPSTSPSNSIIEISSETGSNAPTSSKSNRRSRRSQSVIELTSSSDEADAKPNKGKAPIRSSQEADDVPLPIPDDASDSSWREDSAADKTSDSNFEPPKQPRQKTRPRRRRQTTSTAKGKGKARKQNPPGAPSGRRRLTKGIHYLPPVRLFEQPQTSVYRQPVRRRKRGGKKGEKKNQEPQRQYQTLPLSHLDPALLAELTAGARPPSGYMKPMLLYGFEGSPTNADNAPNLDANVNSFIMSLPMWPSTPTQQGQGTSGTAHGKDAPAQHSGDEAMNMAFDAFADAWEDDEGGDEDAALMFAAGAGWEGDDEDAALMFAAGDGWEADDEDVALMFAAGAGWEGDDKDMAVMFAAGAGWEDPGIEMDVDNEPGSDLDILMTALGSFNDEPAASSLELSADDTLLAAQNSVRSGEVDQPLDDKVEGIDQGSPSFGGTDAGLTSGLADGANLSSDTFPDLSSDQGSELAGSLARGSGTNNSTSSSEDTDFLAAAFGTQGVDITEHPEPISGLLAVSMAVSDEGSD